MTFFGRDELTNGRVGSETVPCAYDDDAKVLRGRVGRGAAHLENLQALMMQAPAIEQLGVSEPNELQFQLSALG